MEVTAITHLLGNWTQVKGPLHRRLSASLEFAIEQGLIPPGTRLPAERVLADALTISRTTVLTAYNNLKSDGWLESRTGSGTWVNARRASTVQRQTHSAVVNATSAVNLLQVDSAAAVDFAVGTTLPLTELSGGMFFVDAEMQKALLSERNYLPLGLPSLREAVAQMYSGKGLPTVREQVIITSGAQQAISLITSLYIQRGDNVLVENPTYFGALDAFRLAGARLSPVPVGPSHVHPSTLRDRLLAAGPRLMYLSPTYHNPTGVVMPESTRRQVAELVDEFGIPLIEDHTLSELSITGTPPGLIAKHSNSGTVLTVGSLSKLFWGGLRVGWVRGPVPTITNLARIKVGSDLGSALLSHAIATRLLTVLDDAKAIRSEQLCRRRNVLVSLLREKLLEWEFGVPEGGLFLWARLPECDSRHFVQCAGRHGVVAPPGSVFAADESFNEWLRIPFVLDEPTLAIGVDRLAAAWSEYKRLNSRSVRIAPIV